MTIADDLERRFKRIDRDAEGFCNTRLLLGFIGTCEHHALDIIDLCPDSIDPTFKYVFEDGSVMYLANSYQETDPCQIVWED